MPCLAFPRRRRGKPEFDHLAVTSQIYDKRNNIRADAVLKYLFGRKGPLTTTGCDHGAFVRTSGGWGGTGGGCRQAQAQEAWRQSLEPPRLRL